MYIADALSRLQARSQTMKSTIDEGEMHAHIGSVISRAITANPASTGGGSRLREHQSVLL